MRGEWIRWWKDKTFLSVLGVALGSIVASLALALLLEWGWIGSIVTALAGGFEMRRLVIKKLDEIDNDRTKL